MRHTERKINSLENGVDTHKPNTRVRGECHILTTSTIRVIGQRTHVQTTIIVNSYGTALVVLRSNNIIVCCSYCRSTAQYYYTFGHLDAVTLTKTARFTHLVAGTVKAVCGKVFSDGINHRNVISRLLCVVCSTEYIIVMMINSQIL